MLTRTAAYRLVNGQCPCCTRCKTTTKRTRSTTIRVASLLVQTGGTGTRLSAGPGACSLLTLPFSTVNGDDRRAIALARSVGEIRDHNVDDNLRTRHAYATVNRGLHVSYTCQAGARHDDYRRREIVAINLRRAACLGEPMTSTH